MQRVSPARLQRFADGAIPLAVGAVLLAVVLDPSVDDGPLKLLGIALALIQAIALWWRRVQPGRVFMVALVGGLGIQLVAPDGVIPYAGVFALGSLAAARPPRVSLPALAALLALAALSLLTVSSEDGLFALAVVLAAWALGEVVRNRRVAIREEARRAVSEEQARIARELHDVIAHSVSVIIVQAGAADHVFDSRPDEARAALRSIEGAARQAQGELSRLLGGVRPGAEGESAHPQPGLERLDELASPLRAAGLHVDVRREGSARALPAGVELSAYRIVQEALTNTLRHAGATRAEVSLRYASEMLELDVVDDGRGGGSTPREGGGYGIVGMRERATMLGGTLDAGPLQGGGYRVQARLPFEAAP
ncbi:MAG: sensor histidine kinase [Gaiellaceae bacterium MAG52_C11]|nr:sensor histidine kinase [Candidatus Gaiellasilicea maunaloa]